MTKSRAIRKRPEPAPKPTPSASRRIDRPLRVLVTAGVPFDVPGTTNLLKVETV